MKNKKLLLFLFAIALIIAIIAILIFNATNNKKMAKNMKIGNNTTSQEIIENILNIRSYETLIEVDVKSNKNENKYILKQKYLAPDTAEQEVVEPQNIAGVKIVKKGNELKLENSKLSLTKIYNNYQYIAENMLDLNCFIEDYQKSEDASYKQNGNEIIMKTKNNEIEKRLYISTKSGLPTKMEIIDNSKKNEVYILYKEVNINNL